jgi:hypothetical protein
MFKKSIRVPRPAAGVLRIAAVTAKSEPNEDAFDGSGNKCVDQIVYGEYGNDAAISHCRREVFVHVRRTLCVRSLTINTRGKMCSRCASASTARVAEVLNAELQSQYVGLRGRCRVALWPLSIQLSCSSAKGPFCSADHQRTQALSRTETEPPRNPYAVDLFHAVRGYFAAGCASRAAAPRAAMCFRRGVGGCQRCHARKIA